MSEPLFSTDPLTLALASLRRDLLAHGGPQISPMRNPRFALWVYRPDEEFRAAAARRCERKAPRADAGEEGPGPLFAGDGDEVDAEESAPQEDGEE